MNSALRAAPALTTIIKSVVKKQLPRRPKSASMRRGAIGFETL